MAVKSDITKTILVCLILALATAAVYHQVYRFSFVNYDDAEYVHLNTNIRKGITLESIKWAMTTGYACFWHPLTWISHMIDWQLYGNNPAGHHITGLIFHILNTVLLFLVFKQMTGSTSSPQAGALWSSAFVAALFALHPLHVESVAWVSERKDVLSTFFWILTMWGYARYARQPKISNYALMLILFTLGMMAKPMLVTLPFVFLLLDYWPLNRLVENNPQHKVGGLSVFGRLVLEKVPMFVIVAAASAAAYIAQKQGRAIPEGENFTFIIRIANASISYLQYIFKMVWPTGLAMFYPHPGKDVSYLYAGICAVILLLITLLVLRFSRNHRYLPVGWFWYIGTLVPVIGIVQVGNHAMADRYSYVTLTGLFIIIAWGVPELLGKLPYKKIVLWAFSIAVLSALAVCSYIQAGYWRNTITLCEHAISVTKDNFKAHFCITMMLIEQGRFDEAIAHCDEAIRINPQCYEAYNNLGLALLRTGKVDEAISCYESLLEKKPDFAATRGNLAAILVTLGRYQEAVEHCELALETMDMIPLRKFYGHSLVKLGRYDEAIEQYKKVLSAEPDDPNILNKLGFALAHKGKFDDAIEVSNRVLEIEPRLIEANLNIGFAYIGKGEFAKAEQAYKKALEVLPKDAIAHSELGVALFKQGKIDEAIEILNKALEIDPNNTAVRTNLDFISAEKENLQKANYQQQNN